MCLSLSVIKKAPDGPRLSEKPVTRRQENAVVLNILPTRREGNRVLVRYIPNVTREWCRPNFGRVSRTRVRKEGFR